MAYGLKIAKACPKPRSIQDRVAAGRQDCCNWNRYLHRKPRRAVRRGQRQRVAMGRAIVRKPAVFLFDEPLSNLDAKLRVQMRLEIKRPATRNLAMTSLYVTHDQVEAMTMADRMIVMNGGIAEQIGTPLEVYETPKTLFAAQFIGSPAMNIFDATRSAGSVSIGNATVGTVQGEDGAVKLGIRPEHLIHDENGPLEVSIQMAEPLGANTLLHGHLTETGDAITISLPGVHPIEEKHPHMRFSVLAGHIHLFDPKSGKRLETQR